jgi:hypothetical protein
MEEIQLLQERCIEIKGLLLEIELESKTLTNELTTLEEQIISLEE